MPTTSTKKPSEAALLTEYEAAQSSAEHYETLIWTVSNTLWALSMVLFGFTLSMMDKIGRLGANNMLIFLPIIGISLLVYSWICVNQFAQIKNYKYERCKAIEIQLGLKQHTKLIYRWKIQRFVHAFLFCLMVIAWIVIIVSI